MHSSTRQSSNIGITSAVASRAKHSLKYKCKAHDIANLVLQDLDVDDASLVTGMLAPNRLSQLTQYVGLAVPPSRQIDEPSLTVSSLHGLSLDDKVATLSALQPSAAAAILGMLLLLLVLGQCATRCR